MNNSNLLVRRSDETFRAPQRSIRTTWIWWHEDNMSGGGKQEADTKLSVSHFQFVWSVTRWLIYLNVFIFVFIFFRTPLWPRPAITQQLQFLINLYLKYEDEWKTGREVGTNCLYCLLPTNSVPWRDHRHMLVFNTDLDQVSAAALRHMFVSWDCQSQTHHTEALQIWILQFEYLY